MSKACGLIFPSHGYSDPKDKQGCLKPNGHLDKHLFESSDGEWVEWEENADCTCGCWEDEEPCLVYRTIEKD